MGTVNDKPFVAWDGEGITDATGIHRYVMLCNSYGDSLVNPTGIGTLSAFQFLGTTVVHTTPAIHVVFGGSYDANMLLRDLDIDSIRELWTTGEVSWRGYRISYRPRKSLTIAQYAVPRWKKTKKGTFAPNYQWKIRLWDVHGFFQSSFVSALRSYNIAGNEHDRDVTETMKKLRGTDAWNESAIPAMEMYCIGECRQLVTLMEQLRLHLNTAGITLARWDGAGAVAASLMKREGVKKYSHVPSNLETIAAIAYSGGRIEAFQYGNHEGKTYVYDINSAYPSVIRSLPDLINGEWENVTDIRHHQNWRDMFGLAYVTFDFPLSQKINPFFYRTKNGSIYYPHKGEGWYHIPEVSAALGDSQSSPYIKVTEFWLWVPETWEEIGTHHDEYGETTFEYVLKEPHKPFAFVDTLYQQRKRWKLEGNGAQMVAKLGMNSLYGKLVQQLGGTAEKRPPYHNLLWGGFITSSVRAQLYTAMNQNQDAIVYSATDGICSTQPLNLPVSKELGAWECTEYNGVTIIQPGVYFLLGENAVPVVTHYRGFDAGTLTRETILDAWREGKTDLCADSTRFIGMGSALASRDYEGKWCTWPTVPRRLTLKPTGKRYAPYPGKRLTRELVPTVAATPIPAMMGEPSHPYKLEWITDDGIDGIPSPIVADECEWSRL